MSLLETATSHLASTLTATTAVSVTYSRSDAFGAQSETCKATRGTTPYEASDNDGIIHRTVERDYLIEVAVFPFDGVPLDGDIITDGDETFVVSSMTGQQPYRYADPGKSLLRIHTKRQ